MEDEEGVFRPKEGSYGASKSIVFKGKRTKRQRSQFPFLFEVNNGNNSGYEDEDRPIAGSRGSDCEKEYDGVVKLSPGSSSERIEEDGVVGVDQEEEDMARCLILLALGRSRDFRKEVDYRDRPNHDRRGSFDQEDQKFNSKRYLEATVGARKIGYYVYECKTCNRTFPSFQALGGHRASHYKKPKAAVAEDKKPFVPPLLMMDNDDEASAPRFTPNGNGGMPSAALYLQLSSSRNLYGVRGKYNNNNNPKVHECWICGAEFSSGQALGGHMRRHRGPAGASPGFSSTPATPSDSEGPPMRVRSLVTLDLDLNLPAPEATVDRNNNVHEANNNDALIVPPQPKQRQGQQDQPRLVFSVPALVDCHY